MMTKTEYVSGLLPDGVPDSFVRFPAILARDDDYSSLLPFFVGDGGVWRMKNKKLHRLTPNAQGSIPLTYGGRTVLCVRLSTVLAAVDGKKTKLEKVSKEEKINIRELFLSGEKVCDICRIYPQISRQRVHAICRG